MASPAPTPSAAPASSPASGSAWGYGLATVASDGTVLDTWFP
ncbi:2,3,4,5-tetrahydropyridine-2,6-dicarboxylate N-succinyltransferase, partial [Clavibacter michiganensis subsp. insidiosus]